VPKRYELIEEWLKALEDGPLKIPLTSWETGFLTDLRDQFDRRNDLSQKQMDRLELIYAEKTE